ncbi:unnamed protein product [Notodromas monacha]|uniref:Peptidase S1 domain-containing protein n=1 Tax=Notodromas monacha TaxID=399045 RepID=A0A7R9GD53_9CRUS|nr:unnamed protein product [Notodromas monacha]CAG0918338.1 unnamed protein product [Notodromas monacha]
MLRTFSYVVWVYGLLVHSVLPSTSTRVARVGVDSRNDDDDASPVIIYGGLVSDRTTVPWMAYLTTPEDNAKCGGSLISARVILTAAQCVTYDSGGSPVKSSAVTYQLGGITTSSLDEIDNGEFSATQMDPNAIVVHEGYTGTTRFVHDVALVKMLTPVAVFTNSIRPVVLAAQDSSPEGLPVTILGWGFTESGSYSVNLLSAGTDIRTNDVCQSYWNCPLQPTFFDPALQTCFGGRGSNGICTGDGGGPVIHGWGPDAVQVGINSFVRPPSSFAGPCNVAISKSGYFSQFLHGVLTGLLMGSNSATSSSSMSQRQTRLECGINTPAVGPKVGAYRAWIDFNADALATSA